MKASIALEVGTFSVRGMPGQFDQKVVQRIVEEALRLVAERISVSSWAMGSSVSLSLEQLSLDRLSARELLGSQGAELLAEEIYTALGRRDG